MLLKLKATSHRRRATRSLVPGRSVGHSVSRRSDTVTKRYRLRRIVGGQHGHWLVDRPVGQHHETVGYAGLLENSTAIGNGGSVGRR